MTQKDTSQNDECKKVATEKLDQPVIERSHANCESGSGVLVFDCNGSLSENAK